jgi:hypothetical protein
MCGPPGALPTGHAGRAKFGFTDIDVDRESNDSSSGLIGTLKVLTALIGSIATLISVLAAVGILHPAQPTSEPMPPPTPIPTAPLIVTQQQIQPAPEIPTPTTGRLPTATPTTLTAVPGTNMFQSISPPSRSISTGNWTVVSTVVSNTCGPQPFVGMTASVISTLISQSGSQFVREGETLLIAGPGLNRPFPTTLTWPVLDYTIPLEAGHSLVVEDTFVNAFSGRGVQSERFVNAFGSCEVLSQLAFGLRQ